MGELKRRFWGGYYKTIGEPKNLLLGSKIFHSYYCGSFTLEGQEYNLMFFKLCKDELADTKGEYQESFDSFPSPADDIMPIDFIMTGDTSKYAPSVQYLIGRDVQGNLDRWEIVDKRVGVMIDEFVEFNFHQVIARYPEILVETVGEDGLVYSNVWKCSEEEE